MKDITIVIPFNASDIDTTTEALFKKAIDSVNAAQKEYTTGTLKKMVVSPPNDNLAKWLSNNYNDIQLINNTELTDFCSQINFAVKHIETDFFSILEYDDEYTPKWFKMAHEYYYGNEEISVFLPVNLYHNGEGEEWDYGNTMALTPTFMTADENDTDDIGVINFNRLEKCSLFNLTGGIINTHDFITAGGFKSSIKVAFNYELLLRMAKKGFKAMVIPKEGYIHAIGRKGSLTDMYMTSMTDAERKQWFALALRECIYDEDRKKDITSIKSEQIK